MFDAGHTALNLIFSYIHPTQASVTLGPFDSIWLRADGMRTEAKGSPRAPYRDHQWDVDGHSYFRLDCTSRVAVHFEREGQRSGNYGPYERFSAVNGLAYGDDRVIAFMDYKSDQWLYLDSSHRWPVMVVSEARAD